MRELISGLEGYKGEDAGYTAKHIWIHKKYGNANKCENPDCERKSKKFEWANISGKITKNRNDYVQLCCICHRKMDLKKDVCRKGHFLKGENLYVNPSGHRECKKCRKEAQRRFKNGKRV